MHLGENDVILSLVVHILFAVKVLITAQKDVISERHAMTMQTEKMGRKGMTFHDIC